MKRALHGSAVAAVLVLTIVQAHADGLLGAVPAPAPARDPAANAEALPPQPPPAPGSPTALVKPFYERFGLETDPAERKRFVDPAKAVLDQAEALKKSGQGDCLDPNMALDNAPTDKVQIDKTLRTAEVVKGDEAKVIVAFTENNSPHRLEWKLKKVGGEWKISDLLSVTGEWALSQYQCQ